MGGLAENLAKLHRQTEISSLCGIARIKSGLDPEDRAALDSVLNSATSTRKIHQVLRTNGLVVDRTIIQLHRRGLCQCAKEAF